MDIEILVVGAGAVGLACAARLSSAGHQVLVLERHDGPGLETTSRNSEVVHAGLYYPPSSLKASCCVAGRRALYARCARYQIPHRKLGKFVVASCSEDARQLEGILERARANDAGKVVWVDGSAVSRAEPRVRAHCALWSPESGIVDALALTHSYQAELEATGGDIAFRTALVALERAGPDWCAVAQSKPNDLTRITAQIVINAAGLEADHVAQLAGINVDDQQYRQYLCKGDYFAVAPSLGKLTQHLIYPVPVLGGLGIHVTMDLGGRFRLGPDVEYIDQPRYDVDPEKAGEFARAAQRFLPEIQAAHLSPDFAGVRPKLQAEGADFRDYVIEEASKHGAPGLINLLGIESPGLTASSAIAERVAALVE